MQFDARQARELAPGAHLTIGDAPGLRLVASTTGRAWVYRYKSPTDGRMRQIKLGNWPAMNIGHAWAAWDSARTARAAGHDPAVERRRDRHEARAAALVAAAGGGAGGPLTVGQLADQFADTFAAARRKPKGLRELRRTFQTMLDPVRDKRPQDITRAVAYDLISRYQSIPVQAMVLRRELGAVWEWAHDSGRLSEDVPNWWRLVLRGKLASAGKRVKGEHQGVIKRVLQLDEVGAILRHLPHVSRLTADLVTLYLWTGCRGAEIVGMEGREISEAADGWWWTIPRIKLKMSRNPLTTDLRVPLVGRALEVVRSRLDIHGTGHLFPPTRGKALHVNQKVIGVAVWYHSPDCELHPQSQRARWPVSGWAPHDLRRTVRTHLAAIGCPSDVAEAVLGHLQPGIEGVYNRHHYDSERRHWLGLLAQRWEDAAAR